MCQLFRLNLDFPILSGFLLEKYEKGKKWKKIEIKLKIWKFFVHLVQLC